MEKRLLMMINKTIMGKASQAHRFCVLAFRLALFMRISPTGCFLCFFMANIAKWLSLLFLCTKLILQSGEGFVYNYDTRLKKELAGRLAKVRILHPL